MVGLCNLSCPLHEYPCAVAVGMQRAFERAIELDPKDYTRSHEHVCFPLGHSSLRHEWTWGDSKGKYYGQKFQGSNEMVPIPTHEAERMIKSKQFRYADDL